MLCWRGKSNVFGKTEKTSSPNPFSILRPRSGQVWRRGTLHELISPVYDNFFSKGFLITLHTHKIYSCMPLRNINGCLRLGVDLLTMYVIYFNTFNVQLSALNYYFVCGGVGGK